MDVTQPTLTQEAGTDEPILEAEHLRKEFPVNQVRFFRSAQAIHAVEDASLTLYARRSLAVVGESGSGKTTIARMLARLYQPTSGTIRFRGKPVTAHAGSALQEYRKHVQLIFQDPFASLNPRHSIEHSLTCGPMTFGMSRTEARDNAFRLLKRVGLPEQAMDRYPHEFSGGQRQRIGIARALMFNPLLLIADEAVSALDVSIQAQVLQLLAELQQETRVAMLFITHDLRVASQICDQIAVMQHGRIVEFAPAYELFEAPRDPYTQTLVQAIPGWRTSSSRE